MNWVSICDKFFLDWLVYHGCIPDDSMQYCNEIHASGCFDDNAKDMFIEAIVTIVT